MVFALQIFMVDNSEICGYNVFNFIRTNAMTGTCTFCGTDRELPGGERRVESKTVLPPRAFLLNGSIYGNADESSFL